MGCGDSKAKTDTPTAPASTAKAPAAAKSGSGAKAAPKIKVQYFNVGEARSAPIRWLLRHCNRDFEMDAIDFGAWPALKGTSEFGGLPRAWMNGVEYGQSNAILRMMGAHEGLYNPCDPKEAYLIDVQLDNWTDLLDKTSGIVLAHMQGKPKEECEKEMADVIEKVVRPILAMMEN